MVVDRHDYIRMARPLYVWPYDGGRVRLPKKILAMLGIKDGDQLLVGLDGGRITLTPLNVTARPTPRGV